MAKPKNKNLERLIRDYLNSAKERVKSAQQLLKIGNLRDSISRSYYAFLDAADALLLTKDIRPKSHAGSISQFSLHFIKTGEVDKKYIQWFRKLERARSDADYEREKTFLKEDAQEALDEANEFIKIVEKLLRKKKI